jgi:hypothetical protein
MNGKGDKRRPMRTGLEQFESNWDRIFSNKTPESDDMWDHVCKHEGKISIAKGAPCNWCGEEE